ncbi:UNVERIFIED_CONTAM: hypothetical protein Sindi_0422000 [Sesamum indicum]
MNPRTRGVPRRSRNFQEGGLNWILIAGGALLSTLSIRLGYKLKQVLDTKQLNNSSQSLKVQMENLISGRSQLAAHCTQMVFVLPKKKMVATVVIMVGFVVQFT